ncbi:NADPH-dependent diflavin oxidoreductase 1 [Gracilariopsis chorda]|uniref:NADPH-dependent diflavin oxidoreductase 1 n=1 Tax=Gracilariopsis chorda TaxID=448386 RepID=A0A2V3J2J2_9FLOR|nr:NADPH-dependent diflavin oxidoreductase 1 [Gracilariopsis chorda]|eukprot:PXF48595.1 NADPH-dependent diflavin oxidoreductase 1 [Gracilariopsis chorda]
MHVPVHVLYATATGTAQDVAQQLAQQLVLREAQLVSLQAVDDYPIAKLLNHAASAHTFILIVSTCGDGHVPITMRNFWNFIRRSDLPAGILSELRFAIFGLGDRAYVKFNAAARKLCTRLIDLGASLITPLSLGDDSEEGGYDAQLFPWMDSVFDALVLRPPSANSSDEGNQSLLQLRYIDSRSDDRRSDSKWRAGEARRKPSAATFALHDSVLKRTEVLTNPDFLTDGKEVLHVELDVTDAHPETRLHTYEPGDIIHVVPRNSPSAVRAFFELTGLDGEAMIDVSVRETMRQFGDYHCNTGMPCTLRQFVSAQLDLTATPRRQFFKRLAPFAALGMEKEKLMHFASAGGTEDLNQYAYREKRTILLVLRDFPSARPPIETLIDMIPVLRPRAFSIASSANAHPGSVHICASLVKYQTPLRFLRVGVCSAFFKSLKKGDCVPIFLEQGTSLRFQTKRPAILIGPGTGVAPMRSYLSEGGSTTGPSILFFGCRSEKGDFLYRRDFELFLKRKTLTKLITAFSREDPSQKVYVQHRIEHNAEQTWKLVFEQGAYVYVAGAAGAMPKAIREVIVTLGKTVGQLSEASSEQFVKRMESEGRLQMECW